MHTFEPILNQCKIYNESGWEARNVELLRFSLQICELGLGLSYDNIVHTDAESVRLKCCMDTEYVRKTSLCH